MATLVSPEQARNIGHAVIDVREFPEYAAGAIKGSRLVPLSTVEQEAANWNKTEPVLLVCRSGQRAAQAAETLERLGFQSVNVLQGGLEAWKAAGLPTNVQEKKPWSLERRSGQSPEAWCSSLRLLDYSSPRGSSAYHCLSVPVSSLLV